VPHDVPQLDWNPVEIRAQWPLSPDNYFVLQRISEVVIDITAQGGRGSVLDVGSAEALQSRALHARGLSPFILDPSPVMLQRARELMTSGGAGLTLVRGVSEQLPFRDRSFDRVLCHSAIDHFAEPERCIEEMTRVCKLDGQVVLSCVNYGSAAVFLSRLAYRMGRAVGWLPRDVNLFWDTPVPYEHTFECSHRILAQLCSPYLEPVRSCGVSFGWMVPGWRTLLTWLPAGVTQRVLEELDRVARQTPSIADFVVSVWRPKPAVALGAAATDASRHLPSRSVVYPYAIQQEANYWAMGTYTKERDWGDAEFSNLFFTGDPQLSWRDDLIRRGPFGNAAVLGCDEVRHDLAWLRAGASQRIDVYDVSPLVIERVRSAYQSLHAAPDWPERVRFIEADLNVAHLPAEQYDVIWSSSCLHHIVELEHLLEQIELALRPGGLFAIHEYVGESRKRYDPYRYARVREVLAKIPARFYLGPADSVTPPPTDSMSPFCAVRSAEILTLARQRFDTVHYGPSGGLFPLGLFFDITAMRSQAPDTLRWFTQAERDALADPRIQPCAAYAVFRKRHSGPSPVSVSANGGG
jgi:ubiquinone/menaquinone biosynthesis C-methylase UbiE